MDNQALVIIFSIASAFLIGAAMYVSVKQTSDPVNPVVLVGLFFVSMYMGKFIFLGAGDELVFSYNYKSNFNINFLFAGYLYCLIGFVLFSLGFLMKAKRISRVPSSIALEGSASPRDCMVGKKTLLVCFAISFSTLVAIFGSMGIDEVFASLNNRFDLFAGRGYFFVGLSVYKVAFFLWVASLNTTPSKWKLLALILPAVLFDLATGSRGKVFFENLLPLFYLLYRKGLISINVKRLLLFGAFIVIAAVVYRSLVRDSVYEFNAGKTGVEIILENLQDAGGGFYAGPEAPYLDTVVLLMQKDPDLLMGSTFAAVLTYPVPRAIYEDKPRGASSFLTERYFPDYFYPYFIEISFPLVAEVYANFNLVGVGVLLLAGLLCAKAYNLVGSRSPWVVLISVFVVIRFVLLFRNDFFNNVTSLISLGVMALLLYWISSQGRKRRSLRRSV